MRGLRAVMKLKPDKVLRDKFFTPESYQHPAKGHLGLWWEILERYTQPGGLLLSCRPTHSCDAARPPDSPFKVHMTWLTQPNEILRLVSNLWKKEVTERSYMIDRETVTNIPPAVTATSFLLADYLQANTLPILASIGHFAANPIRSVSSRLVLGFESSITRMAAKLSSMPIAADLPRLTFKGLTALTAYPLNRRNPMWMVGTEARSYSRLVLHCR